MIQGHLFGAICAEGTVHVRNIFIVKRNSSADNCQVDSKQDLIDINIYINYSFQMIFMVGNSRYKSNIYY